MHLWARYHEPEMDLAARGNLNHPVTAEQSWPYDQQTACAWDSPCTGTERDDCKDQLHVGCVAPDPARLATADAQPSATVTNVTRLDRNDSAIVSGKANTAAIKEALAKGQDVWFGMFIDANQFSGLFNRHGSDAVVPDGDFRAGGQGHAMVLAGYSTQPAGTFYLIHNSWGTDWGDKGYGWVSEATLATNLQAAYAIDVSTPGGGTPPPTPANAPSTSPCQGNFKPDAVLGVCLPTCPDGSARVVNCALVRASARRGQVNLIGTCVVAAPAKRGTDGSGVTYDCAPGGCTYSVPFGKGGCTKAVCARSCPAPKYHLTLSAAGMSCAD